MRSRLRARAASTRADRRSGSILRQTGGATSVEFSLLCLPFILILLSILQYFSFHVMRSTLSDALYQSTASPETALLLGQKEAYKNILCAQTIFSQTCLDTLKLEMQPLANVPTSATPITGTIFDPGSTNDVLLLRSSSSVINILPMFPTLTVKASVVFRRPTP
jgi:Flp pilus assembly protein TadG